MKSTSEQTHSAQNHSNPNYRWICRTITLQLSAWHRVFELHEWQNNNFKSNAAAVRNWRREREVRFFMKLMLSSRFLTNCTVDSYRKYCACAFYATSIVLLFILWWLRARNPAKITQSKQLPIYTIRCNKPIEHTISLSSVQFWCERKFFFGHRNEAVDCSSNRFRSFNNIDCN